MSVTLPPPPVLGLPEKFSEWRRNQAEAVKRAVDCDTDVLVAIAPTGFGKSLFYCAAGVLHGGKTVILTSTKGLQSQLLRDFKDAGMVDVRGKNAYLCNISNKRLNCEQAPCNAGYQCTLKRTLGCEYYAAVKRAQAARMVVTNYSFWFYINAYGEGIGRPNLLVCDEGHDAPGMVADFKTVEFDRRDAELMSMLPSDYKDFTLDKWKEWGDTWADNVMRDIERLEADIEHGDVSENTFKELTHWRRLHDKLHTVATMKTDNWVVEITPMTLSFAPISVKEFCPRLLYRSAKHTILTSASVNYKTAEMLGLEKGDYSQIEYPHTFPVENRLVIHVQGARLNARSNGEDLIEWLKTADRIMKYRQDRKGIFHTVSYGRRDFVMAQSDYAHTMMSHERIDTIKKVREFKEADPPKVLVSPSMSTGWDFPYTDCEFQIIGKVPYPDTRSTITAARAKADPEYAPYIAMQQLVQACGRGCRAEDDHCENFVIDDNITWFTKMHWKFAPKWFTQSMRSKVMPPPPPPKLQKREVEFEEEETDL
jgi:Rad3-related DNA helicase